MMHRPPHASTSTTSPDPQTGKVVDHLAVAPGPYELVWDKA